MPVCNSNKKKHGKHVEHCSDRYLTPGTISRRPRLGSVQTLPFVVHAASTFLNPLHPTILHQYCT